MSQNIYMNGLISYLGIFHFFTFEVRFLDMISVLSPSLPPFLSLSLSRVFQGRLYEVNVYG